MGRLALIGVLLIGACLEVPEAVPVEQPPPGSFDPAEAADSQPPAADSCDDLFSSAPGYSLCGQAEDRCEFFTSSSGDSCSAICGGFGVACLGAWDADAPDLCVQANADDCSGERGDIVCVCARAPL